MEEQYTEHINRWGKVERKGKKNPYTSFNGHMFTFFDNKNGYMAVRLNKDDQEKFVQKYGTPPVIQYNSTMRGYVEIPQQMFKDFQELKPWLNKSFAYINSLEPKPTKKKK